MSSDKKQAAHWKQEDWKQEIGNYSAKYKEYSIRNSWEWKGDKKALYNRVKCEVDKIQAGMDEQLEEKRDKLSELLRAEDEQHMKELTNSFQETEEEKTDRLLASYKELMLKKETERQKIAKEKKEQQLKQNSEEYRTQLSRRIRLETAAENRRLILEKRRELVTKNKEDELFAEMWICDSQAKMSREKEEAEARKEKNLETGKQIRDQILEKDLDRMKRLRNQEGEAEIMAEQARLTSLEEECDRQALRWKKEKTKQALDECLRAKLKRKAKEVQDDLMQDLFFLKQLMDDEDQTKANAKKRALMHEQQEYLKYLRERARQESEFEKAIDRMRQEELDKMWSKRQKEWDDEKKKGRRMEDDVVKGVQEQIMANMERSRMAQSLQEDYSKKVLAEDEKDWKKEMEKLRIISERNRKHQSELLEQIKERRAKLKQKKEENDREIEILRKAEAVGEIQELLNSMRIDSEHPYRVCRREKFEDCK